MPSTALGIDLGTTFTSTAVFDPVSGRPQIVPNADGAALTPSVVWLDQDGELCAGEEALARACREPGRVKRWIKYEMGELRRVPLGDRSFLPEELSAVVLARALRDAGDYLGETVASATVTVPAYFADPARRATQAAGFLAGLESVHLLNEPTASGLCFGLQRHPGSRFLVFDLGGGTLDVSVMRTHRGEIEVVSVAGDRRLGGVDFDLALAQRLAARFGEQHGVRPSAEDPEGAADWQELLQEAETAKRRLSSVEQVQASVRCGGIRTDLIVTRAELEHLLAPFLARAEALVQDALAQAGARPKDLDALLLAGGSTRIPAVRGLLREALPELAPLAGIDPDEVVAQGAAIGAHLAAGRSAGGIERYRDVNALPYGVLLKDAETGAVFNEVLIPRNTPLPHEVRDSFYPVEEDQRQVVARVTQGEGRDPGEVRVVGLTALELRAGRDPSQPIDVRYLYDAEGRVHCDFVDRASGLVASVDHRAAAEPEAELEAGA